MCQGKYCDIQDNCKIVVALQEELKAKCNENLLIKSKFLNLKASVIAVIDAFLEQLEKGEKDDTEIRHISKAIKEFEQQIRQL